ncbi:unnamed protein product [Camellia sinensis]
MFPLPSPKITQSQTFNFFLDLFRILLCLIIHISCRMITRDRGTGGGGATLAVFRERNSFRRPKSATLLHSESGRVSTNQQQQQQQQDETNYYLSRRNSNASAGSSLSRDTDVDTTSSSSPYFISPLNQSSRYYNRSPWTQASPRTSMDDDDKNKFPHHGLIGSMVREEGHIYSLAASGDLLYTGSDSNNIRVWKNFKEYSGFKSNSGLVKAIVISGDRIFTGHQDGKIRVWKLSPKNLRKPYKRLGSLPTTKDLVKSSFNPRSYVEVRRHRNVPWIKHFDAVSCMSLDEDQGLLYSGSWDKTLKVWRISESKCLESINAHDDSINSVVAGFGGMVLTGSADGTVKVWRRELLGKISKHVLVQTLLKQESAVTAVVVNAPPAMIYCGSSDGLVNYWESEKKMAHRGVIRGHKLAVLCLATAGNMLFSGSADKSICVWRRDEGGDHTCLSVLTGHCGPVKCLAVEEDHNEKAGGDDRRWVVYSGSLDKSVKVWRVSQYAPDFQQFQNM